ncbi:MAG TPA: hypothetical protein VGC34_06225 [Steroidobacteraceae bacterium]
MFDKGRRGVVHFDAYTPTTMTACASHRGIQRRHALLVFRIYVGVVSDKIFLNVVLTE